MLSYNYYFLLFIYYYLLQLTIATMSSTDDIVSRFVDMDADQRMELLGRLQLHISQAAERPSNTTPSQQMIFSPIHPLPPVVNFQVPDQREVQQPPTIQPIVTMQPRLSVFNGKDGVTYKQWKTEVRGLIAECHYSDAVIMSCIRRSLRPPASTLLQSLEDSGPVATTDVLKKMESVFGNVLSEQEMMTKLFQSSQDEDESIAEWSCRVEGLVSRIQSSGNLQPGMAEMMKRDRLWCGLRSKRIQSETRHWYDKQDVKFDELMLAIRRVDEMGDVSDAKPKQATSHQQQSSDDKMEMILKKLEMMSAEIKSLKEDAQRKQQYKPQRYQPEHQPSSSSTKRETTQQFRGRCWTCGKQGHIRGDDICSGNDNGSPQGGQ